MGVNINPSTVTKVTSVLDALRKGAKLDNSEAWKNGTIKANLIAFLSSALAAAAVFGLHLPVPPGVVEAAAGVIITGVTLLNSYVHAATSTTVGTKPKSKPSSSENRSSFDI